MSPDPVAEYPLSPDTGVTGDVNWATAVDRWAEWMRAKRYSGRTIELRRYQISHLGDEILRRSPWRVKTADLIAWMSRQDWRPETQKSWNAALRGFYGWAVKSGHTKRNPATDLPNPRIAKPIPRPTPLSVIEAGLARCRTDCERLIIMLAAYGGLRRAEIAVLRWEQIIDDQIWVHGKWDRMRIVPLDAELADALETERQRRARGGCGTGFRYKAGLTDGYVFGGRDGVHMAPNTVGRIAKRILGAGWGAHTLRHSFATTVLDNTGDLAAVQELLGHASPATTRIYTPVDTRRLRAAVASIRRTERAT